MHTRPSLSAPTPAWMIQVWVAFAISLIATAWGIYQLPVDAWMRGFVGLGLFFSISSCFTLAKTVRDQHEARKIHHQINDAEAERILRDVSHDDRRAG